MTKRTNDIDLYVAKRLRELRLMSGISQQELGKYLGVSFQQVQKYENGSNRVSSSRLFLVSKILGVDPSYFFEGLELNEDYTLKKVMTPEDAAVTRKAAKFNKTLQKLDESPVRAKMMGLIKAISEQEK